MDELERKLKEKQKRIDELEESVSKPLSHVYISKKNKSKKRSLGITTMCPFPIEWERT